MNHHVNRSVGVSFSSFTIWLKRNLIWQIFEWIRNIMSISSFKVQIIQTFIQLSVIPRYPPRCVISLCCVISSLSVPVCHCTRTVRFDNLGLDWAEYSRVLCTNTYTFNHSLTPSHTSSHSLLTHPITHSQSTHTPSHSPTYSPNSIYLCVVWYSTQKFTSCAHITRMNENFISKRDSLSRNVCCVHVWDRHCIAKWI